MKLLVIAKGGPEIDALASDLRAYSVDLRTAGTVRTVFDSLRQVDAVLVGFGPADLTINSVGFCRAIRARSDLPIVALVDGPEAGRHVLGLRTGVNEYLCQPYRAAALIARLDVLHRSRSREPDPPDELLLDDVTIDFRGRTISVADRTLPLTNRQYQILALLAEHYGTICPKDALVSRIWGKAWHGADQSLYVHINTLRGKIGRPHLIETVRGEGYRLASPCAMAN